MGSAAVIWSHWRKQLNCHQSTVCEYLFPFFLFKCYLWLIIFRDLGEILLWGEHRNRPAGHALRKDLNGELMNQTPDRARSLGTSSTTELHSLCCRADWFDPKLPAMLLPACKESCAGATWMHGSEKKGTFKGLSHLPLSASRCNYDKLNQRFPRCFAALHQSIEKDRDSNTLTN